MMLKTRSGNYINLDKVRQIFSYDSEDKWYIGYEDISGDEYTIEMVFESEKLAEDYLDEIMK